ncbi:MAG: beta-ketoacyl-ACP synthase II [Anaerolineae bacterium]|jgi:3-oxoacyl-[acyl-carrier-protein] synthase II
MRKRVVVTGLGAVSPLGNDVNSTWDGIVNGRSGVAPVTKFDASGYRARIAAEARGFDPSAHFEAKDLRRMDPVVQFALVAAREAVADAGITFDDELKQRAAVIIGSGIGGMDTVTREVRTLTERGPSRVSPFLIPMILPETPASMAAIEFGLTGPNFAVTSACASGANAIGEAANMLRHGLADVALCGGAENGVIEIALAGFSAMKALSTRNDDPASASRPFDRDRDGFVVGEGAAILIIETLEHAQARGAHIYAELLGYGSNDDAFHITAPTEDGAGAAACMQLALRDADLQPQQIGYINAHGTSTPLNDATETRAIKRALGEHAYRVPVSSTKSMTGHLLGAAGALEAVLCIKAIETGIIPPTMNLQHRDPECDLDYVPNAARQAQVQVVLSNSFGFGGHNACLILGAPQGGRR